MHRVIDSMFDIRILEYDKRRGASELHYHGFKVLATHLGNSRANGGRSYDKMISHSLELVLIVETDRARL